MSRTSTIALAFVAGVLANIAAMYLVNNVRSLRNFINP